MDNPYVYIDMANDGVALLDHLKVEKAHIIGTSMGGMSLTHTHTLFPISQIYLLIYIHIAIIIHIIR